MWFRNLRIYRVTKPINLEPEKLEQQLQEQQFKPCNTLDYSRYGWVFPMGQHGRTYTHSCNGHIMVCARKQEKILPPAAINERVAEQIQELEAGQERSVYRKEKRNIREDVIHSLLPMALTRSSLTYAYFTPGQKLLIIDTPSLTKAEEFIDHLRHTLGSLPLVPISCHGDITEVMTRWLQGRTEQGFDLDNECELRNTLDNQNIVRCRNQELASEEVRSHIKAGKRVIQLALNWKQAIRFILCEDYAIKRLRFEDTVQQQAAANDDDFATEFDQDFAVMTLQLNQLIEDVLQAFGGLTQDK